MWTFLIHTHTQKTQGPFLIFSAGCSALTVNSSVGTNGTQSSPPPPPPPSRRGCLAQSKVWDRRLPQSRWRPLHWTTSPQACALVLLAGGRVSGPALQTRPTAFPCPRSTVIGPAGVGEAGGWRGWALEPVIGALGNLSGIRSPNCAFVFMHGVRGLAAVRG